MVKKFNWNKWTRKTHYWGSFIALLPVLIIIVTGIFLQLLEAAKSVPEAEINSWDDIDRLDVRIKKGIVKVRSNNRWEIQIDTHSGEVTQVAYRRSDLIEQIHDGSWFHDKVKLLIFLPSAIILFVLWITGFYMFLLPYIVKWRKKLK